MNNKENVSVLFVCMGNICRSPTAEGVFRARVDEEHLGNRISIDSAGTHAYHVGDPPDRRATQAALNRDIDLSTQRARRVGDSDYENFDFILAMDRDNLDILTSHCPDEHSHKLSLFLEFAHGADVAEVPDPYYGGTKGFDRVLDLIELASDGFLRHLKTSI